jgi:hypothetical protein
MKKSNARAREALSNHEIVTTAVYLLGGDRQHVDTENVAVKANELAPGRFTWRKYRDQISIREPRNIRTVVKPFFAAWVFRWRAINRQCIGD